jgi:hypothetical protein
MIRIVLASLLVLSGTMPVGAGTATQQEIEHLLGFIEQSGCHFIRNGKTYSAAQARQHIGKKYTYLKKRIKTTEQFIAYAASKSSITGEPYSVSCAGEAMSSKAWLEAELRKYRQHRDHAEQADN